MKIVSDRDLDLLTMLMTDTPYSKGESFEDASINVIFINHLHIPVTKWECNIVEVAEIMRKHIAEHGGTAFSYDWTYDDGVLYVDGKSLGRIASSDRKPYCYDPEADYWEARCLSMGEPVD